MQRSNIVRAPDDLCVYKYRIFSNIQNTFKRNFFFFFRNILHSSVTRGIVSPDEGTDDN